MEKWLPLGILILKKKLLLFEKRKLSIKLHPPHSIDPTTLSLSRRRYKPHGLQRWLPRVDYLVYLDMDLVGK
jgi:hypothetical protein